MSIKSGIREALNAQLKRVGYSLVARDALYEWQMAPEAQPSHRPSELPEAAARYLVTDNARLVELQARYAAFDGAVTGSMQWTDGYVSPDEMVYFRGDNPYVWQLRGQNMNTMAYALTTYYVRSIDTLGLLEKLQEDDCFGNYIFTVDGKLVSRDLLDSIIEIYFLEKHLNISASENLTVLDIGAGYGRMANRMVSALPNLSEYCCTDAIPISTFISEYYLRFREQDNRANVIPIDEIESALDGRSVNFALNIHSFSECRIPAIDWWIALLAKHHVRHLMIVPNTGDTLRADDGTEYSGILDQHGYKLIAKEPKYRDPLVQQYAINPTYHYLFELAQD